MDIYSFINSKAISEYCRKISHRFTPLDMAYLVYANDGATLAQKHAAFVDIIREQPDMEIKERPWTLHFDSLHEFLKTYMELQNKYIVFFYKDEPNCVYSYKIWYSLDEGYTEDKRIFSSFGACFHAVKNDIHELSGFYSKNSMELHPIDICVKKQWVNTDEEYAKYISISIDCNSNPVEICDMCSLVSDEESEILGTFDGLWPEIPTPFQKGDILIYRNKGKQKNKPFVLDRIPYWEEDGKYSETISYMRESGDSSDLITTVYGQDNNGATWHDHGPSYLDLEYYEGELQGTERFLIAVSNYLKGEVPPELLYHSYDVLRNEQRAKEERNLISGFYGELYKKAGL